MTDRSIATQSDGRDAHPHPANNSPYGNHVDSRPSWYPLLLTSIALAGGLPPQWLPDPAGVVGHEDAAPHEAGQRRTVVFLLEVADGLDI